VDQIYVAVTASFLFVALIIVYLARPDDSADDPSWAYLWHRIWRRIAFWAGDVRLDWQWYFFIPFPLISWTHHEYAVTYETLLDVCKMLEPGDLMLATKNGYVFSNAAIPGCFKHAGVIVEGPRGCHSDDIDPTTVRLVEAVSEGVVRRHLLWARGDLMIFLRPKDVDFEDRAKAVRIADKIVGCRYDAGFDFNIEDELKHMSVGDAESEEREELERVKRNFKAEFDVAFSCTEVAAAAWWHKRKPLGIVRQRVRGRMCIVADQFVNRSFQIVWTNVTVAQAEKEGLGEEGLRELDAYWAKRKRRAS
jgi:hypothetical protein